MSGVRKRKRQTSAASEARSIKRSSSGSRRIDVVLPPRVSQEPSDLKRVSVPPHPVFAPSPIPVRRSPSSSTKRCFLHFLLE